MPNKDVNVDLMTNGSGQGPIANMILANGRLDAGNLRPFIGKDGKPYISVYKGGDPTKPTSYKSILVTNATLRRDEWIALDQAVVKIAETRLTGIQDLVSRNLIYRLGNAMGTTVLEYHDISDALEAQLTMDGITRGQNDRPNFTSKYLPIPIIHGDYEINARSLAASRNLGNPLDTTLAERAARKVSEKLEQMLFTDTSYAFGGGTIYSYINFPHRNTVTLTTAWDDASKTAADIVKDVLNMKQASIGVHFYGPWVLYIPTNYETVLDKDYDTTSGKTIRERILGISGIQDVKVIDTLSDDNVLLVQMTSDVVRLVYGMGIQNVEWQEEGKFITKYKVFTIQVPQLRADQNGNSGITHLAA